MPGVFGPPLDIVAVIESEAYSDQMRRLQSKNLMPAPNQYRRILSRSQKIANPPDLGYKILNFLYF